MKLDTWYRHESDSEWFKYFYLKHKNQYIGVEVRIRSGKIVTWGCDFWDENVITSALIELSKYSTFLSILKQSQELFVHGVLENVFEYGERFLE